MPRCCVMETSGPKVDRYSLTLPSGAWALSWAWGVSSSMLGQEGSFSTGAARH